MTIVEHLIKRQKILSLLYSPTNAEVYTTLSLVKEMLDKLPVEVWSNPDLKFCDPAVKSGVFLSEIMIRLMKGLEKFERNEQKRYIYIIENMLYGYATSYISFRMAQKFLLLENSKILHGIFNYSFLEENKDMKFDVIVGNPPYQKQVGPNKSEPIWDKFVVKSFDYLNDGGYLSLVHPSGWRNVSGRFEHVKDLLLSKNIQYLEMHNPSDGFKTFGATIAYDWYLVKNNKCNTKTEVKFQDGKIKKIDLGNMIFIPSNGYNIFKNILAKNGEERCEVLYDRSSYGTDKNNMNREKTKEFKYPCVYTVGGNGNVHFWYSSKNKGHFGIPKVIWGNGLSGVITDDKGEYGLTQFAYAIVDEPKNLNLIKKALLSDKFLKELFAVKGVNVNRYNYKIISLFKKDFWKYFVDENGNEI